MNSFAKWSLCIALVMVAEQAAARPSSAQPATPLSNPGEWATNDDYPKSALREERAGTTRFRLDIDAQGIPTGCTIVVSSGSADLDEATCNLVRMRARFKAAQDKSGRAMAGTYENAVRWVIPQDEKSIEPGLMVTTALLGVDGTYSDCRIEQIEGAPAKNRKPGPLPCTAFGRNTPALDADGKPVVRRIRQTIKVEVLPL